LPTPWARSRQHPRRRAVERARRGSGDLKHNTSSICTKLLPSISRRLLPSYCFCVWIHFVPVPAIKIVSPAVAGRGTTDTTDTTARAAAERDLISRVDNALLVKTIWGRLALHAKNRTLYAAAVEEIRTSAIFQQSRALSICARSTSTFSHAQDVLSPARFTP